MKHVTLRQALEAAALNPLVEQDPIEMPVHEIVCRTLYDIANRPDATERGSLARANKARKMIFERLVGRRRAGSHPATRNKVAVEFIDLTAGSIES